MLALAAAVVFTLILPLNLLESTILFFAPPALYISLQRRNIILRTLVYSTTITVVSIFTDYLAERDHSWVSTSMFTIRLAGSVPIEALVWQFLFTYLIVAYYVYFFDHRPHAIIGRRMPYVFSAAFFVLAWLVFAPIIGLNFTVNFFYIKFGLLTIVPALVAFLICFPKYFKIFLKMTPYFFTLGLLNLVVSLQKGYWSYPGQNFIGWVQLGPYRFPLEELIFWIILFPAFLITQFEFFNNDKLKFKHPQISIKR